MKIKLELSFEPCSIENIINDSVESILDDCPATVTIVRDKQQGDEFKYYRRLVEVEDFKNIYSMIDILKKVADGHYKELTYFSLVGKNGEMTYFSYEHEFKEKALACVSYLEITKVMEGE